MTSIASAGAALARVHDELHRRGWWRWHNGSGVEATGPFVELAPGAPGEVADRARAAALPVVLNLSEGRSDFGWFAYPTDPEGE